jgi:hypothetical protein
MRDRSIKLLVEDMIEGRVDFCAVTLGSADSAEDLFDSLIATYLS